MTDFLGHRATMRALLACSAIAAGLLAGCSAEDPGHQDPDRVQEAVSNTPPRQAILILLDAARPDRMSVYGYGQQTTPHMDALGAKGAVMLRHYAQATYTRPSLPTLISSRYFAPPMFPFNAKVSLTTPEDLFQQSDEESISLFRAASASGIPTAAITAHTWTRKGTAFEREFDELHDLAASSPIVDKRHPYPKAEQVVDYAIEWLRANESEDFLLYLHLMDTHFPHFFDEDARTLLGGEPEGDLSRFNSSGTVTDRSRLLDSSDRKYLDALYDGSMRYTDRHLGRLFEYLDEHGMLEHMSVAITSDHGEHLLEVPGRFSHAGAWLEKVAWAPWILTAPGRVPVERVQSFTENVDVAPTLASLLGVELPPGKSFDGRDLRKVLDGDEPVLDEALASNGIRDERFKAIFTYPEDLAGPNARKAPKVRGRLYDLTEDPLEAKNVRPALPAEWERLVETWRGRLLGHHQRFASSMVDRPPPGAFAIGASSFEVPKLVPTLAAAPTERALLATESESGWILAPRFPTALLAGRPGASEVSVEFALPSGDYHLDVTMQGSLRIRVDGDEATRDLHSRPANVKKLTVDSTFETVQLGRITVQGGTFRAWLAPADGKSWTAVRLLGFSPISADGTTPEEDPDYIERLRALGYVNE